MRYVQNAMVVVLSFIILFYSAIHAHWIYLRFSPPHVYHSAWAESPIIAPGESLRLRYIFTRHRYCETTLSLFVLSRPENSVVWRHRAIGGAAALGRIEVLNVHRIEPDLAPGQYVFRTISSANCPDGVHASTAPDILFEVRESS